MYFNKWFQERGPSFIGRRARSLSERYGLGEGKAVRRINSIMSTLCSAGCAPTFPTPGIVVERHPRFIQGLQAAGAEIAVHGYQHLELNKLSVAEGRRQLEKAVRVFERFGIEARGFRCPYTAYTDELLETLPEGLFDYSSNTTIEWAPDCVEDRMESRSFFTTLRTLYKGRRSDESVSAPWKRGNLIEIPVSLPDDLLLHDGLSLDDDQLARAWIQVLCEIHSRGELFTLMFHPELAACCEAPFAELLRVAREMRPPVWIARLRDISDWWKEKSGFRVEIAEDSDYLRVAFTCSNRATILARGFAGARIGSAWDGQYQRLRGHICSVPAHPLPFVGLAPHAPPPILSFLQEQGYIVENGSRASDCAVYLDESKLDDLIKPTQLIDYIEGAPGPLIRFWRWPNGSRSAMCVTGDLDALSLIDYASRLVIK